jgi:23S rRNA pseudouridine1911/1915/1917 synthase
VVREGDGATVGAVLARAGCEDSAVSEGRVFIGRRRARSASDVVNVGDLVEVAPKADVAPPAVVIADDDGLVAADKPAGLPTIPDHGGSGSLLATVATAIGVAQSSLHATSRLDRDVSGVVVFARTEEARGRLRAARDEGTYQRRYVAIAAHAPTPLRGDWDAPIGRAKDPRRRAVLGRDSAPCLTHYEVVARASEWALLSLEPVTGRTHQLRVHAAHAGAPLLGDRVYGGPPRATLTGGKVLSFDRIALHAAYVRVPRGDGGVMVLRAAVPASLRAFWVQGGGDDDDWERAIP